MGKTVSKTVNIESEFTLQLFAAVEKGQIQTIQRVFKTLDVSHLYTARRKGNTLLHHAVLHGQPACVKFLLDFGIDPNVRDDYGDPALLKVASGIDPNVRDDYGDPALLKVAHCSSWIDSKVIESVINLLVTAKADINATSTIGRTCLLKCIVEYRLATAEKLLALGASPNIGDSDGLHPLHVCATYKLLPLLRKLLNHNANINVQDNKGRTALYLSINAGHQEIPTELVKNGCNVNLGSSFGYPLSAAITKCHPEMVELLLQYGVDVRTKLNEQRQVFLKGQDYLNLSLIVLHIHSAIADMSHYKEEPRIENLLAAIKILDLITQALGKKTNFNKNIFFRSRKPDFSGDPALHSMERKLSCVYKRLVFIHEMNKPFGFPCLEGMPKLAESVDKTSLQNLCRMKLRLYLLNSGTNIMYSVQKLDCPEFVKDMLLLRDIGWS